MRLTARSCIIAGVAFAGAGIFAVVPVAPRLPDVQVPTVELSSETTPNIDQDLLDLWQLTTGDPAGSTVYELNLNELNLGESNLREPNLDGLNLDKLNLDGLNPGHLFNERDLGGLNLDDPFNGQHR